MKIAEIHHHLVEETIIKQKKIIEDARRLDCRVAVFDTWPELNHAGLHLEEVFNLPACAEFESL